MAGHSPFPPAPDKRSPFPDKSLPQAGESLQQAAFDLVFDKCFIYATMAITIAGIAAAEWALRWLNRPMPGWVLPLFAIVLGGTATWRWFRIKPELKALHQAIRGERKVGRMLDDLRRLGYTVFHDIPAEGFNIDHALIGPGGIFAIETKTWSKPAGRKAVVAYDGRHVLVDGQTPDRDPVAQAEAIADYLGELLKRMTARELTVRPVVLFPGWWVTEQPRGCRVWVLNPRALEPFLKNEPQKLSREDVALFADRLTVYLQS